MDRAAFARMETACQHLVNEVKKTLTGQRTGKTYKVPGTKRKLYTASAPGEPPAVRTGRLRNSIKYRVLGRGVNLSGVVGTQVEYAPHLEFGTSKMEPRPFLRPTYERERKTIKAILGGRWL